MEGLGECSGGCVVCVVDTVFEEALVENCGEEVEGFFGIADHDVDDGFLFADVVQLHVICVEEAFAGFIPEVVFIVFPTCVSDNVFG